MADYIDKNELYKKGESLLKSFINGKKNGEQAFRDLFNAIADMPTVEQKHGHWIDLNDCDEVYGDLYKCPFCECVIVSGGIGGKPDNYCSHCGAKMDEVTE